VIENVEDYFASGCGRCERFATADCSTQRWRHGLKDLRNICRDAGLSETVRWGHPCYQHRDRNVVLLGAFRGDFRITFFEAALLTDPEGILERPGPNARHPSMIRFMDNVAVAQMQGTIVSYVQEAKRYAEQGIKASRQPREVELPDELVDALDSDPELAEAFHSLTPGRQRSYVITLTSAKTSATRTSRIVKFRERIIAGGGANER
jgi:uncharacterized protein YdeI (YjbR/CyaY-like superfamily)